jgi:hypothetical protein
MILAVCPRLPCTLLRHWHASRKQSVSQQVSWTCVAFTYLGSAVSQDCISAVCTSKNEQPRQHGRGGSAVHAVRGCTSAAKERVPALPAGRATTGICPRAKTGACAKTGRPHHVSRRPRVQVDQRSLPGGLDMREAAGAVGSCRGTCRDRRQPSEPRRVRNNCRAPGCGSSGCHGDRRCSGYCTAAACSCGWYRRRMWSA